MVDRAFAPVGVVVFGVSTPFVYWGFAVVLSVVEAIAGKTLHLHVSSLEQLREGFARRDGGSVVVTTDLPDSDLAAFAFESGLPLIAFLDDPDTLLDWTMESRGMNCEDAARFCSRMYSSLSPSLKVTRKLVVEHGRDLSPERLIEEIIEYLWPGRDKQLAEQTYAYLIENGKTEPFPTEMARSEDDTESYRQAARAAIASYAGLLRGREPNEIIWPLNLFYPPDNRPWRSPIDLMGPARVLFYGPYMSLPIGEWAARVEFEIEGALSGVEVLADVRVNEITLEKTFEMPAKGIFAYDLDFRVDDPKHDVEIRLFMKKSAIEGKFLPRSVTVRPQKRETD